MGGGLRAALAALVLAAGGAAAQQASAPQPRPATRPPPTGAGGDAQTAVAQSRTSDQVSVTVGGSIQSALGPYGDPFGFRAFLAGRGITTITYIGEGLANLRGGLKRGVIPFPEDSFRKRYHQPARRLSEAEIRIAKRSVGFRMTYAGMPAPETMSGP